MVDETSFPSPKTQQKLHTEQVPCKEMPILLKPPSLHPLLPLSELKKISYSPTQMQNGLIYISRNLWETHVGMDPKDIKTRGQNTKLDQTKSII